MKLAHIFFDVHMANGHAGLEAILKSEKKRIKKDDCVIFVNTKFDTVKILVDGAFLAHYKHPTGSIAPETLRHLPNYLNGGQIEYTRALRKVIYEKLPQQKV